MASWSSHWSPNAHLKRRRNVGPSSMLSLNHCQYTQEL